MKGKKGIVLGSLALLLVAALSLSAGHDKDKWAKLKAELNLSDAQVTQLQQKFEQLQPLADRAKALKSELKALETAAAPDQKAIDAKRAALDTVKKEWKEKATAIYRSVLTREQFAKHEAMQAEYEKSHAAKKY